MANARAAKAAAALAAAVVAMEPTLAELADEFGAIDETLKGLARLVERREALRKRILSRCDKPAAEEYLVDGERYVVSVSACGFERRIVSMVKLKARFGLAQFLKLCTFPLKLLDEHIPPVGQAGLIVKERTGPRMVKSTVKLSQVEQ